MHRFVVFRLLACLIAVLLAGLTGPAMAQDPCAPPALRTDVRPGPSDEPTEVALAMYVIDLIEINDVNQTISADVAMRMQWRDERLAALAGCRMPVSAIWYPNLMLLNSGRIFSRWPKTVSIEEGGVVTYLQRGAGTFSSYHSLERFPFDTQEISLRFFPVDWTYPKVTLVPDLTLSGISPKLNISDWQILGVETVIGQQELPAIGKTYSTFDLVLRAERHSMFYVLKIMLPIALIVSMSWMVFWIDAREFGTQLGLSATAVLTMIAFIFATTNMLPRLGYFTLLDRYIATATVFVFAALLQALTTGYVASRGHTQAARRIDVASRILFPAVFFLLCAKFFWSVMQST